MADIFGQIDLTELGKIVKAHPTAFKNVQFSDGTNHLMAKIVIKPFKPEKQTKYKTDYVKVYVKRDEEKQGVNYFVGDVVDHSNEQQAPQAQPVNANPQPQPSQQDPQVAVPQQEEELPF